MLLIAAQLVLALAMALLAGLVFGAGTAHSVLVGALIGVVPNYYFAGRLMRRQASVTAEQSLRAIYVGEFIKIAFTSALFVIAIILLNINFLVVILTYLTMMIVNWLALLAVNLGEITGAGMNGQGGPDGPVGR